MEICFIGPLGKVTGSCTWMRDLEQGWNFLVDCGMQQGEQTAVTWNAGEIWSFDPAELDFVVLTHAHIDHSGLIPELYRRGFGGKVYCTEETAELAKILLRDAARFPSTSYSEEDVALIQWHTPGGRTLLGGYHPLAQDLFIRFFRSGHIIGAASVSLVWGPKDAQKSIVFSGDIGPGSEDHEVLPFLRYPQHPKPGNYAVLESTYGGVVRNPASRRPEARRASLRSCLDHILRTGGTLALPAFAVGRTQDILFDLHRIAAESPERYGNLPVYLDSSGALKVNQITLKALEKTQTIRQTGSVRPLWLGKQLFRELELDGKQPEHVERVLDICRMTLKYDSVVSHTKKLGNALARNWRPLLHPLGERTVYIANENAGPRVVLMGSGTCDGGAAAQWLPVLLRSNKNMVALSGYCAPSTVGGQLLQLMNVSANERRLQSGEMVWRGLRGEDVERVPFAKIEAGIVKLEGYSAHGDQSDLINWLFEDHRGKLKQALGNVVFLQHGEDMQRNDLANAMASRAEEWELEMKIVKPGDSEQWFDLERGGEQIAGQVRRAELESEIQRLQAMLTALGEASHRQQEGSLAP